MKRTILAAALVSIGLAGVAGANTQGTGTLQGDLNVIVGGVDVSTLSPAQIGALKLAVYGDESPSDLRAAIYSIING